MNKTKPLIAVTMGDPAGVGPEIIAGAWTETVIHDWCRPLVVGHPGIMRKAVRLWGLSLKVVEIDSPSNARPSPDVLPCFPCGSDEVLSVKPGQVDARAGHAAYESVTTATRLALGGEVDAIVTAPLQKEALFRAGHEYPGHTELLAHICGIEDYAMMLYLGPSEDLPTPAGLAVVHVTLHTALRNVFEQMSEESILSKARLADQFMSRLLKSTTRSDIIALAGRESMASSSRNRSEYEISERPRIGVAALNPHGGEGGLFGNEETAIIRPAVERGRAEGMLLEGPLPVDTLMVHARDGKFDAVVAMYHDQGHIALKLIGMHRAVNVTLGLPIIRTSVAHGTAFDIAWRRKAETGSMIEAFRVASLLAEKKE
ncbi:MAG: 4-hydroxythreonine-4-phosphate dehydrogenase PdxA [Pirellulaceae bacterium]|nr:4-hydroxythreonine-4-phosphate dehydrogenase PdxA [Pirellulaceae bacterium]